MAEHYTQRGAAAIEFAFVLPIFILIFYGLTTFGFAFYTQLAVSRAAEDAARSISYLTTARKVADITGGEWTALETNIKNEVINSLAASSIAPSDSNASYATRTIWLDANVRSLIQISTAPCGGAGSATDAISVKFNFPFNKTRMLSPISLPGLGSFASWMPTTLTGCAVATL